MSKYRIKTVTIEGKEPYHYAQVAADNKWMTIYPPIGNDQYMLFDEDTESFDCRFSSLAHAEAHCKMYENQINPKKVTTYQDVNI